MSSQSTPQCFAIFCKSLPWSGPFKLAISSASLKRSEATFSDLMLATYSVRTSQCLQYDSSPLVRPGTWMNFTPSKNKRSIVTPSRYSSRRAKAHQCRSTWRRPCRRRRPVRRRGGRILLCASSTRKSTVLAQGRIDTAQHRFHYATTSVLTKHDQLTKHHLPTVSIKRITPFGHVFFQELLIHLQCQIAESVGIFLQQCIWVFPKIGVTQNHQLKSGFPL